MVANFPRNLLHQWSTIPTMRASSSETFVNTYRNVQKKRYNYSSRRSPHFSPLRNHLSQIKIYVTLSLQLFNYSLSITNHLFHGFQASAAKQTRTAPLWIITQRVVVIPYVRFGTTHQVSFSRVKNPKKSLES